MLGQKFTKNENGESGSALVKLDQYGRVLKERFWGEANEDYEDIIQNDKGIFVTGYKNDRLAIFQIDEELNTVMDTAYQEYEPSTLYSPQLISYQDRYVSVLNSEYGVDVLVLDESFKKVYAVLITNKFYSGALTFQDAMVTSSGKLIITGGLNSDEPEQYNYDVFFAQIDLKTGVLDWIKKYGTLEDYYVAKAIVEYKGKLFVTGMGRNNDDGPEDQFDVYLWRLSGSGAIERVEHYPDPGSQDWGNDINVVGDKLLISGFSAAANDDTDFLTLLLDEDGKLIKTKKFGDRPISSLKAMLKVDDKCLLFMGTSGDSRAGNGWELIRTTADKVME